MRQWLLAAAVIIVSATSAVASDYLNFYAGRFDVTQDDGPSNQYGVEYRYEDVYHGLRPGVGINVTEDEAVYGYWGLFWDLYLTEGLVFTPNLAMGAFHHGNGKDLGHGLEFRSGLELSYEFPRKNRLGVAFNHISNASIGKHNPGSETLLFIYQHPINWFSEPARTDPQRWWEQSGGVPPTPSYPQ